MQRRKLLTAMGSLAAGGAAAMGTGAFTSVSANRTVNVSVADDANALLALEQAGTGPNSQYAEVSDGEVTIDLDNSDTANGGSGVNGNAVTNVLDIFKIRNQGTQPVAVFVDPYDGVRPFSVNAFNEAGTSRAYPSETNPGTIIDPQMSNFGTQTTAPDADSYSLTGVYGSALPDSIANEYLDPDVSVPGLPGSGFYDIDEMTLGVGEALDFGLNIQQYGSGQSFPSDITLTLTADADLAGSP
jgi:hypothetical protein